MFLVELPREAAHLFAREVAPGILARLLAKLVEEGIALWIIVVLLVMVVTLEVALTDHTELRALERWAEPTARTRHRADTVFLANAFTPGIRMLSFSERAIWRSATVFGCTRFTRSGCSATCFTSLWRSTTFRSHVSL